MQPTSLFLDSCAVLHAWEGAVRPATTGRGRATWQALGRLQHDENAHLWTSPLVFEEALFVVLRAAVQRAAMDDGLGWTGWARFKADHPREFRRHMLRRAQPVASALLEFTDGLGVDIRLPEPLLAQGAMRGVLAYIRWAPGSYPLEPADALHLACARFDRAVIVTNDAAFQEVVGIEVLAYRASTQSA